MRRLREGGPGGQGQEGAGGEHRYRMRERLVSIGDDFPIENEAGQQVFYVDGKALRVRNTLIFKDREGHEKYQIQEKMLRVKDTMDIEEPNGHVVATVKKALITPLRERFAVKMADGQDMDIQGNIVDHEYEIDRGREEVAKVSKKWFRVRETYGVEIAPGEDDALVLAITAAIDQMAA